MARLRLSDPDTAHGVAGVVKPGSANHQPVKILWIALGFLKALTSPSGTSHPIRKARCGAIVLLDDLFGEHCGLMHREICKVEEFTPAVGILRRNVCEGRECLLRC